MSQLLVCAFDVYDLSAAALGILRAAVRYAYENQRTKVHTMRIDDFCRLAGLPVTTTDRFSMLLKEARKGLVVIEVLDTTSLQSDDLPYSSWPVFNEVRIDGSQFTFEVCKYTFAEVVLATLPAAEAIRVK
jgi:hypothetical protein